MAAAMLDFSTYIADRTKDFIGREWVFAEIDRWLADPSVSQYFVITGEPGIGKTSLLARLTQTIRVDAHHFCIAREGGTLEPISFIRSINRQLSINLPGFTDHVLAQERISIATNISVVNVAAGAHIYGTYVEKLISQAQSADEAFEYLIRIPLREWVASNQASKCVLILVDAFDEGARLERHPNIPDLIDSARDLPLEVRWLITSRPHAFLQTLPSARFVILDSSAENISDVKKYVSSILDKPPIEKSLRSHRLSIDKVRDELIKRSGGNFLYLRYQRDQLLEAAGAGQAIILSQKPPIGLDGVYLEFLDRMFRSLKDRWEKIYLPVLGAMAVAQDTLSFGQIVGFSGVQAQGVSWVLSDLMQFLDITDAEGDARYRLYHVSFADFLIDHVRNPDYWIDPEIANQRIGEYYWLRYRNQWLDCDRYGVLYLSTHLTQADQGKRLCELLTESSTWMQALFRVHFSHEALVADLNLAITFFEDPLSSNQFLTLIQLYALRSLLQHQVNIYDETDLRILVLLSREAEALGIV